MKKLSTFGALLVVTFLLQCSSRSTIEYNLPPGIPEQNKEHVFKLLDKGATLYKANCSRCHGIFTKGKDTIPNFTTQQVESYKARFDMSHPKNHAFAQNMLREDLDAVFYFLNNRKVMPGKNETATTLR